MAAVSRHVEWRRTMTGFRARRKTVCGVKRLQYVCGTGGGRTVPSIAMAIDAGL
jgi:hypothetical protein